MMVMGDDDGDDNYGATNDNNAGDDGDGASDATTRGGMAGSTRRRVAIKNDGVYLSNKISNLAEVRFFNNYLHSQQAGVVVARDIIVPPCSPLSPS
jgi:hypothetical protein